MQTKMAELDLKSNSITFHGGLLTTLQLATCDWREAVELCYHGISSLFSDAGI